MGQPEWSSPDRTESSVFPMPPDGADLRFGWVGFSLAHVSRWKPERVSWAEMPLAGDISSPDGAAFADFTRLSMHRRGTEQERNDDQYGHVQRNDFLNEVAPACRYRPFRCSGIWTR